MMYVKLLVLLISIKSVLSANILALMVVSSHSHHIFNSKYLEGLAARGHTITYLSVDKYKNPPKNIRHLYIPGIYEKAYPEVDFTTIADMGPYKTLFTLPVGGRLTVEALLNSTELKEHLEIIKKEKFDLVVADFGMSAFLLGVAQFSNAPVMGITAFGIPQRVYDILGNPLSQAINPNSFTPYDENMNLLQKLDSFILYNVVSVCNYLAVKSEAETAKNLFGEQTDMNDIINRINVILVNANYATDPKIPMVPGLVPISGLHIQEPKTLPKDLQKYLDEGKDGVIYFSLGSNVPSTMINKKIAMFTEAFKKLAPIKILWKYDDENFPGKPENVKVSKWLPQNDILAHPNVKLFFTHAGMLSTHEAIHYGVPIVALPVYLDQHANADKCVRQGIGEKLKFSDLTAKDLYGALKNVLVDPKYSENVKKLSNIYRDYPEKPLDRAVYWTEYVIRHKGAPHLRSASRDLYWFQIWLIDVVLIISSVTLVALIVIYKCIKLIIPKSKGTKVKTN